MLHDVARVAGPVVEDLAAQDVTPYTPALYPAFLAQPVVSDSPCVEVVDFKATVVLQW